MNIRDFIDMKSGGPGSGGKRWGAGRPAQPPGRHLVRPASTASSHGYRLVKESNPKSGLILSQTYQHPTGAKVIIRPHMGDRSKGNLHSWKHYDSDGKLKRIGIGGASLHKHLIKFHSL